MAFRELDAFCRGFTYMRVREDERPDNWICQAIFENRSSFAVDLTRLKVRMKGNDDLLFDVHDVDEDVAPNGKWESEEQVVTAQNKPDFSYELSYTVLPKAMSTTEGTMTLEEKKLEVLEADVSKTYSTTSLRSYRSQKLHSTLVLENKGSATINLMRITDDIPGLFEAPDAEHMTIKVGGKAIDDDQFKMELAEGVTIEKEHRSPDGVGHTMTLTVGTRGPIGLKPGKTLEITYPLVAPDPSPANVRVDAPARIEFSAERFGPICLREADDAPSLKVVHNRRNFSAGKQAIPLGGKGRYEVLILFENNGDTALSDLYINDVLPSQFEIKEWVVKSGDGKRDDVTMTSEEGEGGLHLVWHVPQVDKGERLEVSFDIKGSGVVDAEALNRFHGVHFGDEIESDDMAEPTVDEPEASDVEDEPSAGDEPDAEVEDDSGSDEVEATEDDASDDAEAEAEASDDAPTSTTMNFRDDVLVRVMEAHGIDIAEKDAFVAHAANFDYDDNGYLKKQELEDAAKAWNGEGGDEADETTEDETVEETAEGEEKACGICASLNPADATECSACKFAF